jgi:hypothetical protein
MSKRFITERLSYTYNEILERYGSDKKLVDPTFNGLKRSDIYELHCKMYQDVRNDLLWRFDFWEDNLRDFITLKAGHSREKAEAISLGLYTGTLLRLLTEKGGSHGERVLFYMDGAGQVFDYLFLGAADVDQIVLENFSGQGIGSHISGKNNGRSLIALLDVSGDEALSSTRDCVTLEVVKNICKSLSVSHGAYSVCLIGEDAHLKKTDEEERIEALNSCNFGGATRLLNSVRNHSQNRRDLVTISDLLWDFCDEVVKNSSGLMRALQRERLLRVPGSTQSRASRL